MPSPFLAALTMEFHSALAACHLLSSPPLVQRRPTLLQPSTFCSWSQLCVVAFLALLNICAILLSTRFAPWGDRSVVHACCGPRARVHPVSCHLCCKLSYMSCASALHTRCKEGEPHPLNEHTRAPPRTPTCRAAFYRFLQQMVHVSGCTFLW